MNSRERRMRHAFNGLALLAGAVIGLCWVCRVELAEALDGWTARLAEMTLVQYPPGYGEPTPY